MNIDLIKNNNCEGEQRFLFFKNTVGQEWLFPVKNISKFLSLYFPSTLKGKVVRFLLPFCVAFPFLQKIFGVHIEKFSLAKELSECIKKAFNIDSFEFAIFGGSPGRHQKFTLMILKNNKCLGYCKVSDNNEVYDIFNREAKNLQFLKDKGVEHIPSVLFCGELKNDLYCFIQTTERNLKKECSAKIVDGVIFEYLDEVFNLTKEKIEYKETDFYYALQRLKIKLDLFGQNKNLVYSVIKSVELYLAKNDVEYCFYHGDFTPWNSFIVKNHLFVFDFEYAQQTSIKYLDFFHFFTQSCIYEGMDKSLIYEKYEKEKKWLLKKISNADFTYMCYLLVIMEFYLTRDNGYLNDKIRSCFEIWIFLLEQIFQKYEDFK